MADGICYSGVDEEGGKDDDCHDEREGEEEEYGDGDNECKDEDGGA